MRYTDTSYGIRRTDADALSRPGMERDVLQNLRTIHGVASRELLYLQVTAGRPVSRRYAVRLSFRLVVDVDILLNTFKTIAIDCGR